MFAYIQMSMCLSIHKYLCVCLQTDVYIFVHILMCMCTGPTELWHESCVGPVPGGSVLSVRPPVQGGGGLPVPGRLSQRKLEHQSSNPVRTYSDTSVMHILLMSVDNQIYRM